MVAVFGEPPANGSSPWTPEPTHRDTYSLLSSCIITMGLCVWTAVHLNIPEHKKESHQKWRKLKWLVIGSLAPELVSAWIRVLRSKADDKIAFTAFEQRRAAVNIYNFMRERSGHRPLSRYLQKVKLWFKNIWKKQTLESEESHSVRRHH